MRNLPESRSADSPENAGDKRTLPFWRANSRFALAASVCGLVAVMGAAAWFWVGSADQATRAVPKSTTEKSADGRLTISERAAIAVIGGGDAPEKAKLPESLRKPDSGTREQTLINLIENGTEAEALQAIRELATLGLPLNRQRFAAIMFNNRWAASLRTEAALALLASSEVSDKVQAVRALALIGGDANTGRLVAMMRDPSLPNEVRLAAALSMETIGNAQARNTLIEAFSAFPEPKAREQLLGALGKFPFPEIEVKILQVLDDPNSPSEVRVAAVDALAGSSPEALPFLKTQAESDRDPQVRAMAAWAISALPGDDGTMGPELTRLAAAEPEADVRRRLYEAIPSQAINPSENILPQIQGETDLAARVAGYSAIADSVKRGSSVTVANEFNTKMVPELKDIALSDESVNIRMRAVFAIRRAGTPAGQAALQTISQTSNPKIAQVAQHGLK